MAKSRETNTPYEKLRESYGRLQIMLKSNQKKDCGLLYKSLSLKVCASHVEYKKSKKYLQRR